MLDTTTILAGVGVAAAGGLIAVALSQPDSKKNSKVVATTAEQAWDALIAEDGAVLVDIRSRGDAKDAGTPDLQPVKKKLLAYPYTQIKKTKEGPELVVNNSFTERLTKLRSLKEGSLVILLDKDGSDAEAAGKLLMDSGLVVDKVFYVTGGAEAWLDAELPWKAPAAPLQLPSLDLAAVSQSVGGAVSQTLGTAAATVKQNSGLLSMGLTAAAGVGGAVFLITEVELILQVVGVAAATSFLVKNLLDGSLRAGTFAALQGFFADKLGAEDMGEDLRLLARTILDSPDPTTAAQVLRTTSPRPSRPSPMRSRPVPVTGVGATMGPPSARAVMAPAGVKAAAPQAPAEMAPPAVKAVAPVPEMAPPAVKAVAPVPEMAPPAVKAVAPMVEVAGMTAEVTTPAANMAEALVEAHAAVAQAQTAPPAEAAVAVAHAEVAVAHAVEVVAQATAAAEPVAAAAPAPVVAQAAVVPAPEAAALGAEVAVPVGAEPAVEVRKVRQLQV